MTLWTLYRKPWSAVALTALRIGMKLRSIEKPTVSRLPAVVEVNRIIVLVMKLMIKLVHINCIVH